MNESGVVKPLLAVVAEKMLERKSFTLEYGSDLNLNGVKIDGESLGAKRIEEILHTYEQTLYILKNTPSPPGRSILKKPPAKSSKINCDAVKRKSLNNGESSSTKLPPSPSTANGMKKRKYENIYDDEATNGDVERPEKRRRVGEIYDKMPLPKDIAKSFMQIYDETKRLLPPKKPTETATAYWERKFECSVCNTAISFSSAFSHLVKHDESMFKLRRIKCCPFCGKIRPGCFQVLTTHVNWEHFNK